MKKIFDIAKDSEQKWGVIAQGIDGNFEEVVESMDIMSRPDSISWELGIDDISIYSQYNSGYSQYCQGQYSKKAQTPYDFNSIIVGPLKASVSGKLNYSIFLMDSEREVGSRDCPRGYPRNNSTFLVEGSINISTEFKQYELSVPQTHVAIGEAIVVYFYGDIEFTILGNDNSNPINTPELNLCLFLVGKKDNPLDERWSAGYYNDTTGYFAAAPVLKQTSPFFVERGSK